MTHVSPRLILETEDIILLVLGFQFLIWIFIYIMAVLRIARMKHFLNKIKPIKYFTVLNEIELYLTVKVRTALYWLDVRFSKYGEFLDICFKKRLGSERMFARKETSAQDLSK